MSPPIPVLPGSVMFRPAAIATAASWNTSQLIDTVVGAGVTYCAVSALLQDPETAVGSQWLCTRHNTLGAVDDTSSARERLEHRVRGRIDTFVIERHIDKQPLKTIPIYVCVWISERTDNPLKADMNKTKVVKDTKIKDKKKVLGNKKEEKESEGKVYN